ncbi:MAG: S8 family serine peptidase [Solirubrobacterales bacterium]|nr:S8 family serine peptidase [Solirubrobacterales bacterium]MBV9536514.1 S8 family serine peptidase [Solirubrobacterales bacterium]
MSETQEGKTTEPEVDLPAWSLRRDDPRARALPRSWPHRIDRKWAWSGSDGAGVRVAIVDSGIDGDHELVGGLQRAVAVEKTADGEWKVGDDDAGDLAGHGTACAGIVRSFAPRSELWSVRVLGAGFKGGAGALLTGLRWAIEQGCEVVNLSLSTPKRDTAALLHEIADDAYFGGSVFVASAHNLDVRSYPWRFSSVVSVASHDGEDPYEFLYNPDPPVEFFARGMDIEVAWLDRTRIIAAGNSFATAHMTGICALILGKHPALTPFQLKTVLRETATNMRES